MRILFCLLMALVIAPGRAYPLDNMDGQTFKAGVYVSPPFILKDDKGSYYGIAAELWSMIAEDLQLGFEYIEYPTLEALISALERGDIDFIVTNLTVKSDRASFMKFSYPWYDAGLRIMVRGDVRKSLWNELKSNGYLYGYCSVLVILFALTLLLTLIYRRKDSDYPRKWKDGLALSLYNLVVAIRLGTFEGKILGWLGHLAAVIWMVSGIAVVSYVTSTVTTSMTKISFSSGIDSFNGLYGKMIGVEKGGVEEAYLKTRGMRIHTYDNIIMAVEGLLEGEVDAVVGDAPVLEYCAAIHPDQNLNVVGSLIMPDKYAFASQKYYDLLMDSISVKIMELYDFEILNRLKDKYLE